MRSVSAYRAIDRSFVEWDEAHERHHSLRLWSEEFPEALPRDFMHQFQVRNDGIFVFPATYHPFPTHS